MNENSRFRLLLIRHGRTDFNREGVLLGQSDVPLNAEGIAEAENLAKRLLDEPIDFCYASPLSRTMKTAKILVQGRDMDIVPEPALIEFDFGLWDGKHYSVIERDHPEDWKRWIADWQRAGVPGGESFSIFFGRVIGAVEAIKARHREGTVAIVSHSGCIRAILSHYLCGGNADGNFRFQVETGTAAELQFSRFGPALVRFNMK